MAARLTLLAALLAAPRVFSAPLKVEVVELDRPVWLLGLGDPTFLLRFRGRETGARVIVFPLANTTPTDLKQATEQKEDDLGRQTRELALFVAERIFIETSCGATTGIIAVRGGGPVVGGREWPIDSLAHTSAAAGADVIISGALTSSWGGARQHVKLDLWDAKTRARVHTSESTTYAADARSAALGLAADVVDHLVSTKRCKRLTPPATWAAPGVGDIEPYLSGLNQLLAQVMAENGVTPVANIWGEDNMLHWYARVRTKLPSSTPARLMQLRGVLLSKAYGGTAWKTAAGPLLTELGALDDPTDEVYQLSPLVLARFGSSTACATRKAALDARKNPSLSAWLARVDCASPSGAPPETSKPSRP
jgi:hypothetical protein